MYEILLPGLLLLLIGILFKLLPPKKINWIYGYRMGSSMKNKDTWKEANAYAAQKILIFGIICFIIGLLFFLLLPDSKIGGLITVLLTLGFLIATVVLTEIHLANVFDEEGNRKMEHPTRKQKSE